MKALKSYKNFVGIRLDDETIEKIDILSSEMKKSRSDIIRLILKKSLIYVGGCTNENK